MAKKVAIIVRDRAGEALRMGVGATLADDEIHVFLMGGKVEMNEENELNLETMTDLDVKVYSNSPENEYEQKSTEEIAKMIADFDVIVPY
jgi:UDP-N-acetyl-D-mannosaminuronic acid transferase (WecB/TagA/CpsF family)